MSVESVDIDELDCVGEVWEEGGGNDEEKVGGFNWVGVVGWEVSDDECGDGSYGKLGLKCV